VYRRLAHAVHVPPSDTRCGDSIILTPGVNIIRSRRISPLVATSWRHSRLRRDAAKLWPKTLGLVTSPPVWTCCPKSCGHNRCGHKTVGGGPMAAVLPLGSAERQLLAAMGAAAIFHGPLGHERTLTARTYSSVPPVLWPPSAPTAPWGRL